MPKTTDDSIASSTAALDGAAAAATKAPTTTTPAATLTPSQFSYNQDHAAKGGSHDITAFTAARIGDEVWWVKQETFTHFNRMQEVVGRERAETWLKGLGEKLSQSQYDALQADAINGRWVSGDALLEGYKGTVSDIEKANKTLQEKQRAWFDAVKPIVREMLKSDPAVKRAYESLTARLEQQGLERKTAAWDNQITAFFSGRLAEKNILPPGMDANGQFTPDLDALTLDAIKTGASDMLTKYTEGVQVANDAAALARYTQNQALYAEITGTPIGGVPSGMQERDITLDPSFSEAMDQAGAMEEIASAVDPIAAMEDMMAREEGRDPEPPPSGSYFYDDDLAEERWQEMQTAQPPTAAPVSDFDAGDAAESRWEESQISFADDIEAMATAAPMPSFDPGPYQAPAYDFDEEGVDYDPTPEPAAPGRGGWEPEFAEGGTTFRDTMALVGEEGPELVHLPAGAEVIPADFTEAMLYGRKAKRMANGGMVEGATFRNVGPSTGTLYGQEYPRDYPAGVRQLMSGRAIEQPESLFRPAGLRVPSAQAMRRLIPEEVEAYKELGQLAGIPQQAFEREFQEAVPGGGRPRQARMQPRRMRRL